MLWGCKGAYLQLYWVDVMTAFLNGILEEEIFMRQPECCGSVYGLKQSSCCWNSTLDEYLKHLGFVQSTGDPLCIYVGSGGEMIIGV